MKIINDCKVGETFKLKRSMKHKVSDGSGVYERTTSPGVELKIEKIKISALNLKV